LSVIIKPIRELIAKPSQSHFSEEKGQKRDKIIVDHRLIMAEERVPFLRRQSQLR